MDPADFERFTRQLCSEAAEIIRPLFRDARVAVETKRDASPVTIADRNAEARMRQLIEERYPSHGIIGEEYGSEREDADFVWVLDPIDGTKSFISGCPLFGTLVCLLHEGIPVLGAIHQPVLEQLMLGHATHTFLNDQPVQVRDTRELSRATLLTSDFREAERHAQGRGFKDLVGRVNFSRTWGDCYGYLLLASGYADIMVDPVMERWDLLALIPIVRGAGGIITDWHGGDPVQGRSIAAAVPQLHDQVIAYLNQ